jgi:hypothetical protein
MPVPTLPSPSPTEILAANLAGVRARIRAAAVRAGREPESVRLVAVTKGVSAAVAAELAGLGLLDLGENRADALEAKAAALAARGLAPRWHCVGHVQRNKARAPARLAALVHSVDSVRLLETLDRLAGEAGRDLEVLAQVKIADEPSKSGLDPRDLAALLARARELPRVRVAGLMALAPLARDPDEQQASARAVFRAAAALARAHQDDFARAPELSLGMSGDFEVAIEEGATMVRVGALLFEGLGAREEAA